MSGPESVNPSLGVSEGHRGQSGSNLTQDSIRRLKLLQNRKGYRYSVDALMLADFVDKSRVRHCVDLGTGVGIVGLLIAERYPAARVTGIEIQKSMADLAERNTTMNGLDSRVRMLHGDIRNVCEIIGEDCADLVVSNPPFRKPCAGRLCSSEERRIARHEICLSVDVLVTVAAGMLERGGSFCMIHLSERLSEILPTFSRHGIEAKRLRFIHAGMKQAARLFVVEGVKGARPGVRTEPPFILPNRLT